MSHNIRNTCRLPLRPEAQHNQQTLSHPWTDQKAWSDFSVERGTSRARTESTSIASRCTRAFLADCFGTGGNTSSRLLARSLLRSSLLRTSSAYMLTMGSKTVETTPQHGVITSQLCVFVFDVVEFLYYQHQDTTFLLRRIQQQLSIHSLPHAVLIPRHHVFSSVKHSTALRTLPRQRGQLLSGIVDMLPLGHSATTAPPGLAPAFADTGGMAHVHLQRTSAASTRHWQRTRTLPM